MLSNRPFQIDGVTVPTPSSYEFSIEDLSSEETGRTLDGVMHKDVVAVKDYYTCTWTALGWQEASELLRLVDGKEIVTVTYADPFFPDEMKIGEFYVGKRSGKANNLRNPAKTWKDITFQFIRI